MVFFVFVFLSPPLPAVCSVVKKDTMPTDAPKGTWPFSVDSDSSWSQLRAAQGALLGTTPSHPWERAFNCLMSVLVQLWLELTGTLEFIILRGYVCHSLSFCCNLFFKGDMCSSSVQVSIMFV